MSQNHNFTEGPILGPLLRFAVPVLFALFLQAMYGAVDLLVVGKFAASADVSAVSTGSCSSARRSVRAMGMKAAVSLVRVSGCSASSARS